MKTVRLFRDHYEHKGGKVIKHPAGTTVDLPEDVADYIAQAVVETRIQDREKAEKIPGSPENKRKRK